MGWFTCLTRHLLGRLSVGVRLVRLAAEVQTLPEQATGTLEQKPVGTDTAHVALLAPAWSPLQGCRLSIACDRQEGRPRKEPEKIHTSSMHTNKYKVARRTRTSNGTVARLVSGQPGAGLRKPAKSWPPLPQERQKQRIEIRGEYPAVVMVLIHARAVQCLLSDRRRRSIWQSSRYHESDV